MTYKLNFSITYLLIAFVLLFIAITLIKNLWYPYPLMQAVGAQKLLFIIVAVNVGLAIGLAIMIFVKRKKADFIKDIAVAILIQILFLSLSVYGIYKIRPVWIAYNVDRFELILNNHLVISNMYIADKKYHFPSLLSPKYVGVSFSKDKEERTQNMFDEVFSGISVAQRPERYVPFNQVSKELKKHSQPLKILEKYNNKDEVRILLNKYPQADSFVPLQAKALDMAVLLDMNDKKQVIAIVDLRPW